MALRSAHAPGGWAAARVVAARLASFRAAYQAIPQPARRRWLRGVLLGAAGSFALMLLLRVAAGAAVNRGMLEREAEWLARLVSASRLGFSDAVFFQTFGSDITLLILVPAAALGAVAARRPLLALSLFLAIGVMDVVVRFGWSIWDRARPDLLYDGIASPGFHSFPSGHAAKSAAIYGLLAGVWALASRNPVERLLAATLALAIPILAGTGRIAMGVHWPSDVAAGLLLGWTWAALLVSLLRHERRDIEADFS